MNIEYLVAITLNLEIRGLLNGIASERINSVLRFMPKSLSTYPMHVLSIALDMVMRHRSCTIRVALEIPSPARDYILLEWLIE